MTSLQISHKHSQQFQQRLPPKPSLMPVLHIPFPFALEAGGELPELDISYSAQGLHPDQGGRVVWICHALTANADPFDWWPGVVGRGAAIDPDHDYIICANILGSSYGTTGPASIDPRTHKAYLRDFPQVTIRDMVRVHQRLRDHLGISQIDLAIGGSMGGQQILEWAIEEPELFKRICLLATNAQHSPWGIAFNQSQRMALEADPTFFDGTLSGGAQGLEAARAIALLSYRHYDAYGETQAEGSDEKLNDYLASSYQRYQGQKLRKRFGAWSYYILSKAMDSHHVGRRRGGIRAALQRIKAETLVLSINSDVLFPPREQELLARYIPSAQWQVFDSFYGHDGFLTEVDQIGAALNAWYKEEIKVRD